MNVGKIGRLDPVTGQVDEFSIPTQKGLPRDITTGPDGKLWFSEIEASQIGRIALDGNVTEFPLPKGSRPRGIVAGPDGNIWFCADGTNQIGQLTPNGTVDDVRHSESQDQAVWNCRRIGRQYLVLPGGQGGWTVGPQGCQEMMANGGH